MGEAYLQLGPAFTPHKGTYCCLHFIEGGGQFVPGIIASMR